MAEQEYPVLASTLSLGEWFLSRMDRSSTRSLDILYREKVNLDDIVQGDEHMLITGINTSSPMDLVLALPPQLGESASEDYGLQAGNLNSLAFQDPTHRSHNTSPSLQRGQSWHKVSPSPKPRVESNSPIELFLDLPPEQKVVAESASEDNGLQAGNLDSLDFRNHTQPFDNTPPSLKHEQSWHKDSPSPRPRVESTIAGMSLDIETVLGGPLTQINLASDYHPTGDFDENEIKEARLENRGPPEAGSPEEEEWKNEGMLEDRDSDKMHLISEGEDRRADYGASNLRDLRANLPLNRDGECRAGLGQGRRVRGSTRRRRRRRAVNRWIDRWVPNSRHSRV